MTIGIYSTAAMVPLVASLRRRSSFMLDMFFGQYQEPTGQAEIFFDVENDDLAIVPFVHPLRPGKLMTERGYQTNTFKPAYVKPKLALDPSRPLARMMGEPLLGRLTPAQREEVRVAQATDDLVGRLFRRLELMAVEAVLTGKNVITGDGFASVQVDYGRASGNTKVLSGGNIWGASGVSPLDNIEDWQQEIADTTGINANKVVLDRKAFKLLRKDPGFKDAIDITQRGSTGTIDRSLNDDVNGGILKGYLGADGKTELWVYNQIYKDPSSGAATKMIPDYTVMLGSTDKRATGTRAFGTILDPDIGYDGAAITDPETGAIMDIAPKTWTEKDPGQRLIMLQSAPLTALTRPNTTMAVTVVS